MHENVGRQIADMQPPFKKDKSQSVKDSIKASQEQAKKQNQTIRLSEAKLRSFTKLKNIKGLRINMYYQMIRKYHAWAFIKERKRKGVPVYIIYVNNLDPEDPYVFIKKPPVSIQGLIEFMYHMLKSTDELKDELDLFIKEAGIQLPPSKDEEE